ncbi:MAG: hypothetical protein WCG81_11365 [Candidatus Angelobacter sp.]
MSAKAMRLLSISLALTFLSVLSQGQSSSYNGNSGVVSDQDRLLLEKIDRLERRIAELEARAGIDSTTKQTDQAAIPNGKLDQAGPLPAAAARATNSSASSAEVAEPFAFADFTWLNGNSRTKESPLDSKVFTGEFRADVSYIYDLNHPQDHTLSGTQ